MHEPFLSHVLSHGTCISDSNQVELLLALLDITGADADAILDKIETRELSGVADTNLLPGELDVTDAALEKKLVEYKGGFHGNDATFVDTKMWKNLCHWGSTF